MEIEFYFTVLCVCNQFDLILIKNSHLEISTCRNKQIIPALLVTSLSERLSVVSKAVALGSQSMSVQVNVIPTDLFDKTTPDGC